MKDFEGIGLGKSDGFGIGKEGWDDYSGTDSLGMKYPNV